MKRARAHGIALASLFHQRALIRIDAEARCQIQVSHARANLILDQLIRTALDEKRDHPSEVKPE